ncbi:hypothetical protein ACS0TY_016333 [Phlomoides rotata]
MNFEDDNFELNEVQRLEGHTDRVWSLAWKPKSGVDGVPAVLASCSGDKTVRIWEQSSPTGSFQCKAVLEDIHTRTVRTCSWSPSGKLLATGSFDATTAIWEENAEGDFVCVSTLEGHENEVKSVAWNRGGTLLATCGRDKSVWIWEVVAPNEVECISVLQGHTQDVKMVQWNPVMDHLFSCSYDNTIKVWVDEDVDDWQCAQTLNESFSGHTSTVWALSFNATGDKMVSCSDDLTIKIWGSDIEQTLLGDGYAHWIHLCTLSGYHDRTIFSVHWSREGIISTGAADDAIRLFVESKDGSVEEKVDGPTYRLLHKKEKAHDMDVNAVQWSHTEHRRLASASDDGTIKIWELVSSPGKKDAVL